MRNGENNKEKIWLLFVNISLYSCPLVSVEGGGGGGIGSRTPQNPWMLKYLI